MKFLKMFESFVVKNDISGYLAFSAGNGYAGGLDGYSAFPDNPCVSNTCATQKGILMTRLTYRLFAFLLLTLACHLTVLAQDDTISLFDGKTLKGWDGNPALWSVEDGCIVGKTGAQGAANFLTYNQFLTYEGDVPENFVLEFDIWLSKDGNSGMQFRSRRDPDTSKPWRVYGYQADFDGAHTYSGIVYGENFRGILANRGTVGTVGDDHQPKELKRFAENDDIKKTLKVEDWNHYKVTAQGNLFIMELNGVVTSILIDEDKEKRRNDGVLAIQAHEGLPMKVMLKNIKIK
jgi:hypothetical protein